MKRFFIYLLAFAAVTTVISCSESDEPEEPVPGPTITWASNPDFNKVDITDEMDVKIQVDAPAGIKTFKIAVKSEVLNGKGITELDLIEPGDGMKETVDMILGGAGSPMDKTSYSLDLSKLVPMLNVLTDEESDHTFTLTVGDKNDKTATKTAVFHRVAVLSVSYKSAVGSYYGTDKDQNIATYQIRFSTKEIMDDTPPVDYLYLMLSGSPVTDLSSLKIETGTYTIADEGKFAAGKFYPGELDGEEISGSSVMKLQDNENAEVLLVTGGEFSVTEKENKIFDVSGSLELQDGTKLKFSYSGALVVDNLSSEGRPADELELPQSTLTEDVKLLPIEGYVTYYTSLFHEYPDFDYVWLMLYCDNNYEECIDLGLIVDKTKNNGLKLPVGKYPMMNRYPSEFTSMSKASVAGFAIKTDSNPRIGYGCWYTTNYNTYNPLVDGKVEIISFDTETNEINLSFELKDNATSTHTVSGTFNGKLQNM